LREGLNINPLHHTATRNADRRQYSTIREGGAESLQDLNETAGLPKYLTMILRRPAFLFPEDASQDTRQYSTIREDGAESLQDLSETAGLPKYLSMILRRPAFLFSHQPMRRTR
jgi:hypothetical protein